MASKLFIGSLSYNVTSAKLEELFSEYGKIQSAEVIIDRQTGQSKGFGFVEMENSDDAKKAIEGLNGKEVDGRTIVVNEARPRAPKPFFGGMGSRGGGGSSGGRGGFGSGGGGGGGGRSRRY